MSSRDQETRIFVSNLKIHVPEALHPNLNYLHKRVFRLGVWIKFESSSTRARHQVTALLEKSCFRAKVLHGRTCYALQYRDPSTNADVDSDVPGALYSDPS